MNVLEKTGVNESSAIFNHYLRMLRKTRTKEFLVTLADALLISELQMYDLLELLN